MKALYSRRHLHNSLLLTLSQEDKDKESKVNQINSFLKERGLEVQLKTNYLTPKDNDFSKEKLILDYYTSTGDRQTIFNLTTSLPVSDLIKIENTIESTEYRNLFSLL